MGMVNSDDEDDMPKMKKRKAGAKSNRTAKPKDTK
jgi:hypothetical protein